ncbi:hypothetical protein VP395_10530 [Mariniflexile soesokkakense]|uniref:DUF998 domain-containing protein n=1 Tax=Mariniflexile soesokkakense TaxID=1343160 RepID=A0ABV0ADZ9_9FLAO
MNYNTLKINKLTFYFTSVYIIGAILLVIIFYVGKKFNIPFENLTGDPALTFKAHPFTGILSNVGILLWCFTASVCFFSGTILFNINDKNNGIFLICSGIFTSVLLIDDFFMFHDYIFYSFKNFTITQPFTYAIYLILSTWYIIKFHRIILNNTYLFLVMSLGFLGLSASIDLIFESKGLEYFIEDGFKFIGIINWMLFFSITAYQIVLKSKTKHVL